MLDHSSKKWENPTYPHDLYILQPAFLLTSTTSSVITIFIVTVYVECLFSHVSGKNLILKKKWYILPKLITFIYVYNKWVSCVLKMLNFRPWNPSSNPTMVDLSLPWLSDNGDDPSVKAPFAWAWKELYCFLEAIRKPLLVVLRRRYNYRDWGFLWYWPCSTLDRVWFYALC